MVARDPDDFQWQIPVEKIITGRIAPELIVDKGFRSLLDPKGNEMKVMVKIA